MNRRYILFAVALALPIALAAPALADPVTLQRAADEIRITDWIRAIWPIVLLGGGLLTTGVMLGLSARFVTIAAFTALRSRVDALELGCASRELRVTSLEKSLETSPTRLELQEDISELSERMRGVEVGIEGIHGISQTTNSYLHALLERGLRGAA